MTKRDDEYGGCGATGREEGVGREKEVGAGGTPGWHYVDEGENR